MLEKRDYKWMIGILLLIIVFILSYRLVDNINLVNYIGFAGTLISIVLAIIAILYSFYQNNIYENSTRKLDESSEKIKNLTGQIDDSFNKLSNDISKIESLGNVVASLQNAVSSVEEISYEIKGGVLKNSERIEGLEQGFKNSIIAFSNRRDENKKMTIFSEEQIKEIVENFDDSIKFYLRFLYKCYKEERKINTLNLIDEVKKVLNEKVERMNEEIEVGYFMGVLYSFNGMGFIDFDLIEKGSLDFIVLSFNEMLGENIIEVCNGIIEKGIVENSSKKIFLMLDKIIKKASCLIK